MEQQPQVIRVEDPIERPSVSVVKNRKKSATYYEKHKADILARRKERYQAEKDRLQAIQREYARKKRAERKAERGYKTNTYQ